MSDAGPRPAAPGPGNDPDPGADPLHCIEVVELVTDYLEGALMPDEKARLDAHLATCEPCGRYVEQVRQTIAAAGRVEVEPVPPDVLARLLGAYRDLRGS